MAQLRSWITIKGARFAAAAAAGLVVAFLIWRANSVPAVDLVRPTRGDAAEVVYATGVVEPRIWAKVVALQRKRIIEICKCEGTTVRKGQSLAKLDDGEEQAILTELQARRDTLADDVERTSKLADRGAAPRTTLDEKRTQLAEIEARITAQVDRISDLDLRAPMDGIVLREDGEVGEVAGTGNNDELFWVGQPRPLEIEAEVNEEDIAKVKVGQSVLLRHEGHTGSPLTATVREITPKGNPATKTFRAIFALPDDTPLMIGMSVEANIVVQESKNTLLVPAEALIDNHVLTVDNGRIKRLAVTTGIHGARMVEVLSGLDGTTPIVAIATTALQEGLRVRATAPAGAKPP